MLAALLVPVPATVAATGASRLLLTPTADPSTSQYVSWSSSAPRRGQLVVAVAADGTTVSAPAVRKVGTTKRTAGTTQVRYVARLAGLSAATRYRYRVLTNPGATGWRSFRTAPGPDATVSVLQFGDTQIDNAGVPEDIIDAAARRYPGAGLMLHAGDVVNHPWVAKEWRDLHRALSPSGQSRNWLVAIGNHEQCLLVSGCRSGDGRGFRSYFQGASNGFADQRRTWYFVDHGPARFIVLDSFGKDLRAQRAFLREAARSNPRAWTIVLLHSGPFASRGDRRNTAMRKAFLASFERYGVDLVLSGHDHSYARGAKAGVTYVTSVSGPKYYTSSAKDWRAGGARRVRSAYRTSTYQALTISPTRLRVDAIVGSRAKGAKPATKVGRTLDSFTLTSTS